MPERTDILNWIAIWRQAGPALERVRADDIRRADTVVSIRAFEGLLPAVLASHPPQPWSGLVEQQRLFARCRRE